MLASLIVAAMPPSADLDWTAYGHDPGGMRYVREADITKDNVTRLKQAWTFHTGDLSDAKDKPSSAFECTPLFADTTLYVVSPFNRVFALDPDSGKAKWTFDPHIPTERPKARQSFACRGLATWVSTETHHRRIFLATYDARLIAIDARTGKPIPSFGKEGAVNLKEGVGTRYLDDYNETSAPCVIGDTVVVGSSISDNMSVDMPSGKVRAFDVRTGKQKWEWDPCAGFPEVNRSIDPDYWQKSDATRTGAGNAWATISADVERKMVFVPTGSPSPDFCGIQRPGNDADADSVVALDAETGRKIWAFQTVHHDLWDYDVPAQPILCDVAGKPAVVAMTKMGHVFVLDRVTGQPLLPVEERPVPTDGVPGEPVSPTQPFPVLPKPLVPDHFEPWALGPSGLKFVQGRLSGVRQGGVFTPPSIQGTLIFPGNLGGCNWSGGSFDPASNTLYVNTNNLATVVFLIPRDRFEGALSDFRGHEVAPESGTPYGLRRETVEAPGLIPGNRPPWGQLHAVDLATGLLRWEVPLGSFPDYDDIPKAKEWGSPNLGGSFVTSTGLVFIAATLDPHIRAFDGETGKALWAAALPAPGNATPMSYVSPKTGRRYVVQCAGGHHGMGPMEGDQVVAFALPADG